MNSGMDMVLPQAILDMVILESEVQRDDWHGQIVPRLFQRIVTIEMQMEEIMPSIFRLIPIEERI